MTTQPVPRDRGPLYVAGSAQLDHRGDLQYRALVIDAHSGRLSTELLGSATPTCEHISCRLVNLADALLGYQDILRGGGVHAPTHLDQLDLLELDL